MQASVQVLPHIVDTALKYLTFCNSAQSQGGDPSSSKGQDTSDKTLDEACSAKWRKLGRKAIHRLAGAKTLLCSMILH